MKNESIVRQPVVAGMFYPAYPAKLKEQINTLVESEIKKLKKELATPEIIGGVVPHAGYIYSGYEAVHFFELVKMSGKEYDTIVILNPDHQGFSPAYATVPHEAWETPLGRISIDRTLAEYFPQSELAHREEHSAEVMLPFIQIILGNSVKILPISIGKPTPEIATELAKLIYDTAKQKNRKILIIASSDFSHYVTPSEGVSLDNLALEKIKALDSQGLFQTIRRNGITICGYGPIMTLIEYSRLCTNLPKVEVAARGNSGRSTHSNSVVDYITIIFSA